MIIFPLPHIIFSLHSCFVFLYFMKAFVFDTETTGFTVRDGRLDQQPYIIQFAWVLGEVSPERGFEILEEMDILIKPPISIPFSASQVNGIYDRDVAGKEPLSAHIEEIMQMINTKADIVVAHNIEYDRDVISYELERLWRAGEFHPKQSLCTMRSSTDYCQLQWRGLSYKPPRLNELYRHLFGTWFEWAHNAMVDVKATAEALGELVKRGVIILEEPAEMRLF